MNRIYQGRVTGAQLLNTKGEVVSPPEWDWQSALWEHHVLFQDAVNYYVFCLLALASDPHGKIFPIRAKLSEDGSEHGVWQSFARRGAKRPGMRESIVRSFGIGKLDMTPEECFDIVLEGNAFANEAEGKALLDLALREVLVECDGEGAIQQEGRGMLPRLCWPGYKGGYPRSAESLARASSERRLSYDLHRIEDDLQLRTFAEEMSLSWVVNLDASADPYTGGAARERLHKALAHFLQAFGEPSGTQMSDRVRAFLAARSDAEAALRHIERRIEDISEADLPEIPRNRKGPNDRIAACLLFKYFPGEFTASLLKTSFPFDEKASEAPATKADAEPLLRFGDDPIKLARGSRGYVFRAFTSLPMWDADDPARLVWKEFDIAAFKEALKALHQVDTKGEERAKERERMERRVKVMSGEEKWKPNPLKPEEEPPLLKGDKRIERLAEIVDHELKQEYEMSEGVPVAYGLHPRTIRGFRDLRREWNKVVAPGEEFSDEKKGRLLAKLRDYQKENPTVIGSVRLYEVLLEKENWLIWQEPGDQSAGWWKNEFASDPVQALTDERQLKADIERLRQPIKFTPADAVHSRRQFYFSDLCNFTDRGEYRHEPNSRSVIVPLAVRESGAYSVKRARLHYSAPRFLRDGLRIESAERLANVPFLQPMMAALDGIEPLPQDFRDCPVALMPEQCASGEIRILLNFPITIDHATLATALGKQSRWEKQFTAFGDQNYYLNWPERNGAEKKTARAPKPKKEVVPWWEQVDGFRCLAVDLGQRDAGACALIDVRANENFAGKPSREIGRSPDKIWRAHVAATCLLRLPGEDARVIRNGAWATEFYGEQGRSADAAEWQEARQICAALGLDEDNILGTDLKRFSFPELNDRLLFALRRAQTHLARFQRWSWMLKDETIVKTRDADQTERDVERRGKVCAEIGESEEAAEEWKNAAARNDYDGLLGLVSAAALRLRAALEKALVQIANRVAPLRGRNWEWVARSDDPTCHILSQTQHGSDDTKKRLCGQRGLSMERLEQFEELRRRCQSLNRALRQTPGERPKLGATTRGVELPDPCPDLLLKMEELREQRVNQTAHLILAQALGVRLRAPQKDRGERVRKDIHGEYERFRDPVDFIILEDLARYLSSQGRARSENSRLMKWCHRAILKKLKDLCTPYGIPVVEATAAYSSRFCSRSGVAGFRAIELTPDAQQEWVWQRHFQRLKAIASGEAKPDKDRDEEAKRVKALFDVLEELNAGRREAGKPLRTLLAPMPGGPIFVPLQPQQNGTRRPATQADINAAINLGLRAIAAPDCHDIHVRMRAEFDKAGKLNLRVETKREKARWGSQSPEIVFKTRDARKAEADRANFAKENPRPNFFIDHGGVAKFDHGRIDHVDRAVASGRAIWSRVRRMEWATVNVLNNDRLAKWNQPRRFDEGSVRPARSKAEAEAEIEEDQFPM